MGYYQAAQDLGIDIEITGIDIEEQPNYPFNFIRANAIDYMALHGDIYTHIHASPPCQKYSQSTAQFRKEGKVYTDILTDITELIIKSGKPGVIENVTNSPVRPDIVLRGDMFGLRVLRKRHFQLENWFMMCPMLPKKIGTVSDKDYITVIGKGSWSNSKKDRRHKPAWAKDMTIKQARGYAMGIDWMKDDYEFSEAIPPAYTRYIGYYFLKA